jgi:hypothetical protein
MDHVAGELWIGDKLSGSGLLAALWENGWGSI